jgi:uncharacterized RDD family membrane protein YckC
VISLSVATADLSPTGPPALEGVGFGRRAVAQAIDLTVHSLVGIVVGVTTSLLVVIGAAFRGVEPDQTLAMISADSLGDFIAALVGATAMHILAEWLHGSTIGKRLCGITVIHEDGGPADFGGVVRRNIAYYVDAMFFGLVAYHKMAQSPRSQRVGDQWGRTMVVRIRELDPGRRRSGLRFVGASLAGLVADGLIVFLELASRLIP